MKVTLTITVVLAVAFTSRASAQSPLKGFWIRDSIQCEGKAPVCAAYPDRQESWAAQIAIDVQGDRVYVSGPKPVFPAEHVDTFSVDGRMIHWTDGRHGIAADSQPRSYSLGHGISRPLYRGESWTVSADGRQLVHRYQYTNPNDKTKFRMVMTYRRSAN